MRFTAFLLTVLSLPILLSAGQVNHRFTEKEKSWWAIQPLTAPSVPKDGKEWAQTPVDHFIARKLSEAGLQHAPQASPEELVRRIYFDLHGLSPTTTQRKEFLEAWEKNPKKAWDELIDQLLADRRYGERWATHWLDVVRYAETDGYRADDFRPNVYMYRDYVIQSLNEDKPYDQFVREQLAADEIAPNDPEKHIATAFLRHGVYEWNQRNAHMQWDIIINEMTRVTGEVFMGLGIGCAQCHDHKFDPILQKDYYSFQSFLSSVWWPENRKTGTPEQMAQLAAWEKETAPHRKRLEEIKAIAYRGKDSYTVNQFPADVQTIYRKPASERTTYEEQIAQLVQRQVDGQRRRNKIADRLKGKEELLAEYNELVKKLKATKTKKPTLKDAFISVDVGKTPAQTFYKTRKEKNYVEPEFLTLLGEPAPNIKPTKFSTGRRTALANWLTRKENPLSTRVIVNRIWQNHFGAGIVPTPNDFGTLGEPPSHPELLDWMTQEFLQNNWSLKSLHKLILQSATYQQTARREPSTKILNTDPTNRLLWRFSPKRLSAEQVRDTMLYLSGELKEKNGGPSVDGKSPNRSVYVKKRRNSPDQFMECFDAPSGFDSAPKRLETHTPTQALLMLNAGWPLARAKGVATRIQRAHKDLDQQINSAYELVYSRTATNTEVALAKAFIQSSAKAKPEIVKPKETDQFPNENGLRPITQHFAKVDGLGLGKKALWLQPGSRFEQLQWKGPELQTDSFTIEAVAILDNIHKDASVNTLASRWNGNHKSPGWALGVTSAKSRYQPRNFILQLIGENTGGSVVYEVVASNLRIPTGKPVYLAASIETKDNGKSQATFHWKDLSTKESKLESVKVDFSIAERLQDPKTNLFAGGRQQTGHLWDGQLARLVITPEALSKEALLIAQPDKRPSSALDFQFNGEDGETPVAQTSWNRRAKPQHKPVSGQQAAFIDFCHALLNSNEFLYLH